MADIEQRVIEREYARVADSPERLADEHVDAVVEHARREKVTPLELRDWMRSNYARKVVTPPKPTAPAPNRALDGSNRQAPKPAATIVGMSDAEREALAKKIGDGPFRDRLLSELRDQKAVANLPADPKSHPYPGEIDLLTCSDAEREYLRDLRGDKFFRDELFRQLHYKRNQSQR